MTLGRITAAIAVSGLVLTGCADGGSQSANEEESIKIGVILAISGPLAAAGGPTHDAMEAMAAELNEQGGIEGRELELLVRDSAGDPTAAAQAASAVIDEGAVLIVGETSGQASLGMLPVAAGAGVPVLNPTATIATTDPDAEYFEWVYRLGPSDTAVLAASWDQIVAEGYERAALAYSQEAYGELGNEHMKGEAETEDGIEIVAEVSAAVDATDVRAQATRLQQADPDVIALNVAPPNVAVAFLRAFEEADMDVPVFGGFGLVISSVLEAAGTSPNDRLRAPALFNPVSPSEELQRYFDVITERGYDQPSNWSLYGIAAIRTIEELFAEAGVNASSEDLLGVLQSGLTVEAGHLVPLEFSAERHDAYGAEGINWLHVVDGEWQPLSN